MKKLVTIAVASAVAMSLGVTGALAVPGKGKGPGNNPGSGKQKANGAPSAKSVAAKQCKAERKAMGNKAFKALYGKGAGRNCIKQQVGEANGLARNAAHECKAEMADPNFPTTHGGMTFAEFYGTNHNDRNAFGKCVSGKVGELVDELRNHLQNAAHLCKAERNDPGFAATHGGKSFEEFYGKNKNMKNAFGKCVSGKAKQQPTPPVTTA